MELQKFLRENSNWEEILSEEPYCLKWKEDGDYILFSYNQLSSDFSIPLVREARGIIFTKDNFDVVCRPYCKFGNYGESYAATIDWTSARISQKIDGSLIKMWFHNEAWHISTNNTIDASNAKVEDFFFHNYKELFLEAVRKNTFINTFYSMLDKNYTYMFELVSPSTRVVIPYSKINAFYLSRINNKTGEEIWGADDKNSCGLAVPKMYTMNTLEEVVAAAELLPWDEEGYVVFDKNFNRVKIKSPQYVIAHYARNNGALTSKRLIKVVLDNEVGEFLTYCEDYKDYINLIYVLMQSSNISASAILQEVRANCNNFSRKEYAIYCKDYPKWLFSFLMNNYENNITWNEYTKDWSETKWDNLFESKYGKNYLGIALKS